MSQAIDRTIYGFTAATNPRGCLGGTQEKAYFYFPQVSGSQLFKCPCNVTNGFITAVNPWKMRAFAIAELLL